MKDSECSQLLNCLKKGCSGEVNHSSHNPKNLRVQVKMYVNVYPCSKCDASYRINEGELILVDEKGFDIKKTQTPKGGLCLDPHILHGTNR
ncbi:MAG: hypothetical protein KAR54_00285 [Candidatus Pacebacteria bacterium]|nr:hypothetical protein [Candidatus Paceibacterota bacterium]